jgi:tetratricopeptide (TPR) repeat protein
MLSEEALILVGALAVLALLVLGVLELLWPTRARRRRLPPPRPRPVPVARFVAPPAVTAVPPRPSTVPGRELVGTTVPAAPAPRVSSAPPPVADADVPLFLRRPEHVERPAPAADGDADAAGLSPAERCARLLAAERYAEAAALAHAGLAGAPGLAAADRGETARLWSLMARACFGRGEGDAARRAMESAIGVAPADAVPAYQQQLAALVRQAVPALLGEAGSSSTPPSRLAALREALAWLDVAAAVGAVDELLSELGVEVQAALWPAWEQAARVLLQRQDFSAARRLLREALGDARLPRPRAEAFRTLLRRSFGGEVGQLTAQAVRSVQQAREADALDCLRHAERLLATLDDDVLPPARREELSGRVGWSYARLGTRRLEAGEFESALELLFQALRFERARPGEPAEAHAGLVHALERVVEARAAAIRRHVDTGDRAAALDASRRLWRLLEMASERGVGETALGDVKEAAQRVTRELADAASPSR